MARWNSNGSGEAELDKAYVSKAQADRSVAFLKTWVNPKSGAAQCPFCGFDAESIYMNLEDDPHYRMGCKNPKCRALGPKGTIMTDEELRKWNTIVVLDETE